MPGQPDGHRGEAVLAVPSGDVAQAVGRVGQAMEEHDRAAERADGFERI